MKKNLLNIFTIVVPAIILINCIFSDKSNINIMQTLENSNLGWLLCAILSMVSCWLFESVSLHLISKKINKNMNFKEAIHTSMIGQLFNCITPFASGGQPMQAYCMVKCGIPIGQASSILLIKFIIYQIILTLYSLIALIFRFQFFANQVSDFSYLVFIGFIVNSIIVIGLICVGFFPNITKGSLIWGINILNKFKLIKDKEKKLENINNEINNFYNSFKFLKNNILAILKSSFVIFLQLTAFFAIPYFICLALKVPNIDLFTIISAGAFVLMISSFIPLPGGSGGAEASFYLFFGIFFPKTGIIAMAILIWRGVTFYMPILAGILCSNINKTNFSTNI